MEVGGLSGGVFLLRVAEAMQSMAEARQTVAEALRTIFGVRAGTKPIRILQFMGMAVYNFINGLPILKLRSLLLKPPYLQAGKLSTDDSLDTSPVDEASISANDATLKDLEITMSAVREWAATQGSKFSEAVYVNNLGKWKTATQMTALTILLATRYASLVKARTLTKSGVLTAYVSDRLKFPLILCKYVTDIVDDDKPAGEEFLQNLVAVTVALDEAPTQVVDFISGKCLSKL